MRKGSFYKYEHKKKIEVFSNKKLKFNQNPEVKYLFMCVMNCYILFHLCLILMLKICLCVILTVVLTCEMFCMNII